MSEWDDKINKLLVEVDALDDNPDKSALDALWLKVLTIATGVQNPPAEALGELVNDVLDCLSDDALDSCSDQLDVIFSRIEASYQNSDGELASNIWSDFLHVVLGDLSNIDEFKQLVYCVLTPPDAIDIEQDGFRSSQDPQHEETDKFPIDDAINQHSKDRSQDDAGSLREVECVSVEETIKASEINVDNLPWPEHLEQLSDEEAISTFNRLFTSFHIDAKLHDSKDLKNYEKLVEIRRKLNLRESEKSYKSLWSTTYSEFISSQGITLAPKPDKANTDAVQEKESIDSPKTNNDTTTSVNSQSDNSPLQQPSPVQDKSTPVRHFYSSINTQEEYLDCAIKHLDACKAILVAHDKFNPSTDDAYQDLLMFEEVYYLAGYILECILKSFILNHIQWNGDNLETIDVPLKHLSWGKKYGYFSFSSHFTGWMLSFVKKDSYWTTVFEKIPLFNGRRSIPYSPENREINAWLKWIFRDRRIRNIIYDWKAEVRYHHYDIFRIDAIMLIKLCDLIVKSIIKNFGKRPSIVNSDAQSLRKSISSDFHDLVSRYYKDQQNINAV